MQSPPCKPMAPEHFGTPPGKCFMLPPAAKRMRPASPSTSYTMSLPSSPAASPKIEPKQEDVCMDDMWREVELAKEESGMDMFETLSEIGDSSDDEDMFGPRRAMPALVRLPCGDLHLCGAGYPCKFLVPNDDHVLVCQYSGVEHGPEQTEEFFDLNGGMGKRSGDPDQNCGEPVYGKWTKRVDPVAASKAAFEAARGFDESNTSIPSQYVPYVPDSEKQAARKQTKRGALCVGEAPPPPSSRRGRISKKNINDRSTVINLQAEAESVLSKLINYDRVSAFKRKPEGDKVERKKPPPDPRMCDEKFVFNASVKKYVRGCMATGTPPSVDAIHNLSLMAQTISKKAREEAASIRGESIRSAKFRSSCAGLIVALWSAACASPYMSNAKRGTDAFRPFVCGCIYGFKRGVNLPDGSVLIPTCPELAAALPVLRGTGGNALAKTLHSSSHRGLCTISRCIASVPQDKQASVFANVIRIASAFASQTFSAHDI